MTDTLRPDPRRTTTRRPVGRRVVALAGAAVLGVAAFGYVGVRDPHDAGAAMPVCPVHWATGLDCPGCGGLRMTHDLLHGDLGRAFADNAVLLLLAPLLLFLLGRAAVRWAYRRPPPAGRRFELNGPLGVAIVVLGIGWTVVRNLAGW